MRSNSQTVKGLRGAPSEPSLFGHSYFTRKGVSNSVRRILCLALAMCLVSTIASAGVQTVTDTVALQDLNIDTTMTVPQFNPALGVLQSVKITLGGHVEGTAAFENMGPPPAVSITWALQASMTLKKPDTSVLVVTLPSAGDTETVDGYDGIKDYDGLSGRTYAGLSADKDESNTLTGGAMGDFIGLGNIVMPFTAIGQSFASGSSNMASQFTAKGSADVEVVYTYGEGRIPEPAGLALLGLVGLARRKRR